MSATRKIVSEPRDREDARSEAAEATDRKATGREVIGRPVTGLVVSGLRADRDRPIDQPAGDHRVEIAIARERAERTLSPGRWMGGSDSGRDVQRQK